MLDAHRKSRFILGWIENANVNLLAETMSIEFKDSSNTDTVIKKVKSLGYGARLKNNGK